MTDLSPALELVSGLIREAERIRVDAEDRMETLYSAAELLEKSAGIPLAESKVKRSQIGTAPDSATKQADKPSLTSLVRDIIKSDVNKVWDRVEVKNMLLAAHPDDEKRIKTGLYQSFDFLKDKNEIHLEPEGYKWGPKPNQP